MKNNSNLVREFRKIPSANFLYEISKDGVLRNVKSKRIIKGSIGKEKNGEYIHVMLVYNGKSHHKRIHQLVMECWGETCPGKEYVIDHIDGNKTNNDISNLRWATRKLNLENSHYTQSGQRSEDLEPYKFKKKKVKINGIEFKSRYDACKFIKEQTNCKQSIKNLSDRMYLKRKNILGFNIEYLD